MSAASKKTPEDVSEFEREQLRFFLSEIDPANLLQELNPSLAWLSHLAKLKVIDADTQLAPWIQKNFAEIDAIREVAANINFFRRPETADILESHLNQTGGMSSLAIKCWRLIIRHMRAASRGMLRSIWFDIAPRIKHGEHSPELLEQLAHELRPKLRVSKHFSWRDTENVQEANHPADLMKIDYEIDDGIKDEEVLLVWPANAAAEVDDKLLKLLSHALDSALADAIDAGVESNDAYSLSDRDVRSVAKHEQNAYRAGFRPIVRVMADLWSRLVVKDDQRALALLDNWRASQFRLVRRLALFAAADTVVPANIAANVLMTLPAGELFLTNSSVEVFRLIDTRWRDFAAPDQLAIERRITQGPPAELFREDHARLVDRCRFDLLGHLERNGNQLGANAQAMLVEIRKRWPDWSLGAKEQAGFHIWHESSTAIIGDPSKLSGIPDAQLVSTAKKVAGEAGFHEGDAWRALCETDPQKALCGLTAEANSGQWPTEFWRSFLWPASKLQDVQEIANIAKLLLEWPRDTFTEIASDASRWLNEVTKTLDEKLLWPLWESIAEATAQHAEEVDNDDALAASLNHPAGRLAEVLFKRLTKSPDGRDLLVPFRTRFDRLMKPETTFGRLARIRTAAQVSFLFELAPEWTKEIVIPLFDWSSPDAAAAWSARKYANYVGSPKLFELTKRPFLELFGRADVSDEERRIFAEWLAVIMIANQASHANYPITSTEARSALRQAGVESLYSVGHRLAMEMERATPDEKISRWRDVVGPVFQSIWPLDIELQTSASTHKLVQLLCASGSAFPEAAKVIVRFIRPDESQHHSVYSISKAHEILYSSSPETLLDLVAAVVGGAPAQSPYGLHDVLNRIREHAPRLANTKKFQKLLTLASNS